MLAPDPRLRVLLMQLPVPNNPGANVPLAAGYLKAFAVAQGLPARGVTIDILPRALADQGGDALLVAAVVARRPHVLALSLYTWNSERTLGIALLIRQHLPELVVIVGGPEVQPDNYWVLTHPAVDVAVDGEGEQTFCALLEQLLEPAPAGCRWCAADSLALPLIPAQAAGIPGTLHRHGATLVRGARRPTLETLAGIPSPYLAGYLELRPGEMALVECSRWCPYGCTFCLYGRSMGTKLGGRLFDAERILAEVAWARAHGAGAIHFVEANLNLLPIVRELIAGLEQLNLPDPTPLYAELRGEHLKPALVADLVRVGLTTAEVGLQSANPEALARVGRRTDLAKWAAGTRLLHAYGVEVLLDVILGLPGEDRTTTLATIDWIAAQNLGNYDIFTLQVLPGTGVRAAAAELGLRYQERPPYYVLATDRLSYSELRGLRWELREQASLDPQAVEGMPQPPAATWTLPPPTQPLRLARINPTDGASLIWSAMEQPIAHSSDEQAADSPCVFPSHERSSGELGSDSPCVFPSHERSSGELGSDAADVAPVALLALDCAAAWSLAQWAAAGAALAAQAASHVTVRVWHTRLTVLEALCAPIARANPLIHWDLVLDDPALPAADLRAMRSRWPHTPGYLDRVAVFRNPRPQPDWHQVTPRCWMVAAWDGCDALTFEGVAEVVWQLDTLSWSAASAQLLPGTPVLVHSLSAAQQTACAALDLQILDLPDPETADALSAIALLPAAT